MFVLPLCGGVAACFDPVYEIQHQRHTRPVGGLCGQEPKMVFTYFLRLAHQKPPTTATCGSISMTSRQSAKNALTGPQSPPQIHLVHIKNQNKNHLNESLSVAGSVHFRQHCRDKTCFGQHWTKQTLPRSPRCSRCLPLLACRNGCTKDSINVTHGLLEARTIAIQTGTAIGCHSAHKYQRHCASTYKTDRSYKRSGRGTLQR